MPLRYLVTGMQDVMARGEGPAAALPAIGILLGFTAVVSAHRGPDVPLGRHLVFNGGCGAGQVTSGNLGEADNTVRESPRAAGRGAEGATSPEPLRHQDRTGQAALESAGARATEGEPAAHRPPGDAGLEEAPVDFAQRHIGPDE